ncbi:hypothetical protein [Dinoroseobacter sp. S375]|uniref:hypothetical protein n=1 Tax=Dinoroseobacter sp. S375 TaxID=3415136 RepID=UPI003C7D44CA
MVKFKYVALAVLVGVAAATLRPVAGGVEGRLFPVVKRAQITSVDALGETRSVIYGTSSRLRSCAFRRVDFFLGTPEANARVDLDMRETSKVRPGGEFDFGPWLVQLTPDQFPRAFAVVKHRCHPFWLTESLFYLGSVE